MSTVERKTIPPIPPGYSPEEWAEVVAEREALVARCLANVSPLPSRRDVDENGRLLPISDEDWNARMSRLPRFWEELAGITGEGDTDADWERFMRNIDDERRSAGMRTLYEGMY